MARIVFVNRYFSPDQSATSQILSDLAFELARSGHSVHVITSRQLYNDSGAQLPTEETLHGVVVHRLSGTQFGRAGLAGRALDYASFYTAALRASHALVGPGDIIIPKTDPPLLSILGARIGRQRGAKHINWLQDIYPEVASELGVFFVKGPVRALLSRLRNRSLRKADANVVVGHSMAERLSRFAIDAGKIHVIPNWCDDEQITPVPAEQNPLRRQWQLTGKFVIGYSGNLGRAHEYHTLLSAAETLRDDPRLVFLFVGSGHRMSKLADLVESRDLTDKFRFLPYQGQDVLKYSLSVPDVHWVSLRPQLEGLIVPSKFYGIAAAGRPIIAVTAATGEIARLVEAHKCGYVVEPGDVRSLIKTIVCLSENQPQTRAMGRRARQMLEASFTRRHTLDKWRSLIAEVANTDCPNLDANRNG